ncbi:hypothetical protein ARALYDRAFT_910906 [Arabidopsis lyrata subsp. lyrata]|uniref:Serine/threonine-protein kinase BSK n=1 Tax=Arabidopsis lyrata subsp. lyrata TaxID=81972 RepID=D7M6S4_ARALL|nr:hypothetical protein ARALYDRAFT_910906 [Arabidopsis lyrata subsp. lyrata]
MRASRHKKLGYCCDEDQRLLVAEFMPNDTLAQLLFHRSVNPETVTYRSGTILVNLLDGMHIAPSHVSDSV